MVFPLPNENHGRKVVYRLNEYHPYAAAPPEQSEHDVSRLWQYLRVIGQHKTMVGALALAGVVLGVFISFARTPTYQSRASLEMLDPAGTLLQTKSLSAPTPSFASPDTYVQTNVNLLQSDVLIRRVVSKINLSQIRTAMSREGFGPLREMLKIAQDAPRTPEQIGRRLQRKLSVRQLRGTNLIVVEYDSPDPEVAAAVVNAICEEYVQQDTEQRIADGLKTRGRLSQELVNLKRNLEESEYRLLQYAQVSDLVLTSGKDNVEEEKLKHLESELSRVQAIRMAKQSQYETVARDAGAPVADTVDNGTLREYQVKLTDLRREFADLSTVFSPAYHKVARLRAQITELESAVAHERAKVFTTLRDDYEAASANEKLVTEAYRKQAKTVSDQGSKVVRYDVLRREVDTNRSLYDSMLQAVQEAGINSTPRAVALRVVDPGLPASTPLSPRIPINTAAGLLAGVLLGVGVVLATDHADTTLRDPGKASRCLGLTQLGVIPSFGSPVRATRLPPPHRRDGEMLPISLMADGESQHKSRIAHSSREMTPAVSEAFRTTLASILLSGRAGVGPRVILFTSPGAGEGKSTIVSHLGIALAEFGQRVLLIGADLRRPKLHDVFGIRNRVGLSDLLQSDAPFDTSPSSGFVPVPGVNRLFLLPSGTGSGEVSSQLHSRRMAQVLQRVQRDFDMILIDTAPVLYFADARLMARFVDAVVLLVRCGRTSRHAALCAKNRFSEDGTPILGAILNDWNSRQDDAGYGVHASAYDKYYA